MEGFQYKKTTTGQRCQTNRKPYIIQEFGKQEFSNMILINFERNPDYNAIFKTLIPAEIIERITLFIAQKPVPGKSLLFLNEIQELAEYIPKQRKKRISMQFLKALLPNSMRDKN
jgi:hypothetical protein